MLNPKHRPKTYALIAAGMGALAITLIVIRGFTPLSPGEAPESSSLGALNQDTLRALSTIQSQPPSLTEAQLTPVIKSLVQGAPSGRRLYVLSSTGEVLAHSVPSYVGTSFKDTPLFTQLIRTVFHPQYDQSAALSAGSGAFRSIDQLPVLIAYRRLSTFPLVFVSEEVQKDALASPDPLQFLLLGTLITGILLFLAVANLVRKMRKAKAPLAPVLSQSSWKPVVITQNNFTPTAQAAGAIQAGPVRPVTNASSVEQAIAQEKALEQTEQEILSQFQLSAFKLRDPKMVASILAESSSQLCKSPTLFFRYDPRTQSFVLETEAGLDEAKTPHSLHLSLGSEALARITQIASSGQVASLAQFEPLAKLLIQKLGVSYYEAWVLNQGSKIYGLLVILQASLDSIQRRDFLMSMIKTTGLIYDRELR